MRLATLQLKRAAQRLSRLQRHWREQLPWDVTRLSLCPSRSCLAKWLETYDSTFLIFLLDWEYCNAFIALCCQQVPNAGAHVGQPEGQPSFSTASGRPGRFAEAGQLSPRQHSASCLRTRGPLPKSWHRILGKEDADVHFLKVFFFQAPGRPPFSLAPTAPSFLVKTAEVGNVQQLED